MMFLMCLRALWNGLRWAEGSEGKARDSSISCCSWRGDRPLLMTSSMACRRSGDRGKPMGLDTSSDGWSSFCGDNSCGHQDRRGSSARRKYIVIGFCLNSTKRSAFACTVPHAAVSKTLFHTSNQRSMVLKHHHYLLSKQATDQSD